jgi:hypothetical protein
MVAIILGVVALAVVILVTIKWYGKYKRDKAIEAQKLADYQRSRGAR